ncbi:MAG TPA: RNB domain-containing ribonuclease [Bryobacteraceae bacterium]|nr:RNB domain-containing ribonuclease [Bryobacteraceae bacterium]
MPEAHFDLAAAARQEMIDHGFAPDLPAEVTQQAERLHAASATGVQDLRSLVWSSIDNDDSRDLDQIEWAERNSAGIRVLVAIADVDACVAKATPIDRYACSEATTVYTGIRTFPMLPERLSTDLTSLAENQDRAAAVIEVTVGSDGTITAGSVYPALVRNRAQLTYSAVGPWLEGTAGPPPKVARLPELQSQLKLQDEAARCLAEARHRLGALTFDRTEAQPVFTDGLVSDVVTRQSNRAAHLIEDFMIAANETIARTLREAGVTSIRRVVKAPERWPRIVELARGYGEQLPAEPDAGALNKFLEHRRADPVHYSDISLAVLKLMGPGEYVMARPGDPAPGHFGLAAHDYTHSTAPNRRFADLVTQRLLLALSAKSSTPYSDEELSTIARNCTLKEDAARKVQRDMNKRIAAVALQRRIGQKFSAVVTGVTPKGVFVRVLGPPVEGRLMRGEHGLDVGDRLSVTLLGANPRNGFIDFGR